MSDIIDPDGEEAVPVMLGDRRVGWGIWDEGYFHIVELEEDVQQFLTDHHGLTTLSISENQAELGLKDD